MIRGPTLGGIFLAASIVPAAPNPVFPGADPHALVMGDEYWIYPTEARSGAPLFAAYSSKNLCDWKRRGVVLRLADVRWVNDDQAPRHAAWAPGVAARDGKIYFYFSVGPQNPTPSRIGVAVGNRPEGPFEDSGRVLITGDAAFEAIDPMAFLDRKSGAAFLYAGGSAGSKLRVWELAPEMVRLKRECPVEQPPHFTEGAFMHERQGVYYLSYSHGKWNDASYSVHYATGPSPLGPWEYRGAILESDERRKGPGHHAILRNPSTDEWFIVYHRWETSQSSGPYRGARQIAIEPLRYRRDGALERVRMTDVAPRPSPISK